MEFAMKSSIYGMGSRSRRCAATLLGLGLLTVLGPDTAQAQAAITPEASVEALNTLARMIRWSGVVTSVFVILGAWLLLRFVGGLVDRLGLVFVERRLLLQELNAFFRFGTYILTISLIILLSFEISAQVLAVLGGTAAVAFGFAVKDLVASLVAGVMIMFDRPFQVGDRVRFSDQYGDILSIGLRSVKLRTLDDSMVTIPNNLFLTDVTSCGNYGVLNMQIEVDFLIGVDQDVKRARRIVREAAATSPYVHLPKPIGVLVKEVVLDGYVALQLRLKAYVLDTQYEKIFETDVTLRIREAFSEEGIQPPAILHRGAQRIEVSDLAPSAGDGPVSSGL
jgi:small-conductance mechanosensitive channel